MVDSTREPRWWREYCGAKQVQATLFTNTAILKFVIPNPVLSGEGSDFLCRGQQIPHMKLFGMTALEGEY
jgi:hypothetical protein